MLVGKDLFIFAWFFYFGIDLKNCFGWSIIRILRIVKLVDFYRISYCFGIFFMKNKAKICNLYLQSCFLIEIAFVLNPLVVRFVVTLLFIRSYDELINYSKVFI